MERSREISLVSEQLASLVELTMDPAISHAKRSEAYTTCEQFKETSPLCAQCGLFMAQQQDASHFVRHFGLQLMEHCVKYRWNQIAQEEKIYIKENAMKLLGVGMDSRLEEHTHIKDALSRVIVEMIKREWPQQWGTLLPELFHACSLGESQTELVCFVFLRLVEDVALLQTLESQQRRKDIYQALTMNMGEIFGFFIDIMRQRFEKFDEKNAPKNNLVIKSILMMLGGYLEWVNITHIMTGDLLEILCKLQDSELFQTPAADCLLQIVNRKGRIEERAPLMMLFSTNLIGCMFSAALNASKKPPDDQNYNYLKKLTQVLTGLGTQLCALWGKDDGLSERPPNLGVYLECILPFSQHPSLLLVHYANALWLQFFKHEYISKDPVFAMCITKWVELTAPRIIKQGFPSNRHGGNPDSCLYARLDHDSDEDYAVFFCRFRVDLLDTFRQATLVAPLVTFQYVEKWLIGMIEKSRAELLNTHYVELNLQSWDFLEWEALSQLLESVLSRILIPQERPSVASGLHLLDLCVAFEPQDPLILSILLSCISALFVFLSMAAPADTSQHLARVLQKIFAALTYSLPGQTKENRSRAVKNVRRHAASLMVKIGQKYPLLLLPMFNEIHSTINVLTREPSELSKMEAVTLLEALVLINNHFCNFAAQSKFIGEIIGEGAQQWLLLGNAFKGPATFMAFVGLDRPPVEPSSSDLNGKNRSQIMVCINLILGVVKRSAWPEDPDRAHRGGFVVAHTQTGNPIYRNPATQHVLPLLSNIFHLLRVFNALWTEEAAPLLSEGYRGAHQCLEVERWNLLALGNPSPVTDQLYSATAKARSQSPLDRMQTFLSIVHDTCYHVLGNAGQSFGREFYQVGDLAPMIVNSIFENIAYIPDYRMRPMVRVFLKPFVHCCPPAFHESVVVPVFTKFCPFMLERLSTKWVAINDITKMGDAEDENRDAQEVLEDILNRTVTREYMDLLKISLLAGSSDSICNDFAMEEGTNEGKPSSFLPTEVISELGILLLRNQDCRHAIVMCIMRALSWNDTAACHRATGLVSVVVRQLLADGLLDPDSAKVVLISILQGLQTLGRHEHNQGSLLSLGTSIYDMLRPSFPRIQEVMLQIPGCTMTELKKLDDKIIGVQQKANKLDKAKKDIFKKLTMPLTGRDVSLMFRKEVCILSLPPLKSKVKPKVEMQEPDPTALHSLFSSLY